MLVNEELGSGYYAIFHLKLVTSQKYLNKLILTGHFLQKVSKTFALEYLPA